MVQDDEKQSAAATHFIECHCTQETPGFISHLVLAELLWVLGRGYCYEKPLLIDIINRLLMTKELKVQQPDIVWAALHQYKSGIADFPDYLIAELHQAEGCETTITFDRKAAKSPLHQLLKV
jgi:predicted nucleic-acid-binding protein